MGPVEIRWDSSNGPLMATVSGADFARSVTVPAASSGSHRIVAFSRNPDGTPTPGGSQSFEVTQPPVAGGVAPTLAPGPQQLSGSFAGQPADKVGALLAGAALTRQNGTRAVSRTGVVTVFCGRFTEAGVSGVCRASSTRSSVLRLGAKRFRAQIGRPVLLKFVLTKPGLKMLRAAKKVRMRGSIEARDASGNLTRASFGFTLKAPPTRSR